MYTEGMRKESDTDDEDSPLVVGHNIYILAYKLAEYKKELRDALDKALSPGHTARAAVEHYDKNTAQIEVSTLTEAPPNSQANLEKILRVKVLSTCVLEWLGCLWQYYKIIIVLRPL